MAEVSWGGLRGRSSTTPTDTLKTLLVCSHADNRRRRNSSLNSKNNLMQLRDSNETRKSVRMVLKECLETTTKTHVGADIEQVLLLVVLHLQGFSLIYFLNYSAKECFRTLEGNVASTGLPFTVNVSEISPPWVHLIFYIISDACGYKMIERNGCHCKKSDCFM